MAHRSKIIATAIEVVLDRRVPDEQVVAETQRRIGGTPADQAAAEAWATSAVFWCREIDKAHAAGTLPQVDGRSVLRGVRDANRPVGIVR